MRVPFLSRQFPLIVFFLSAGLSPLAVPQGWAQAAPANGGLFPDAKGEAKPEAQPAALPPASLRGLLQAITTQDQATLVPMTWQLLAAMSKAKDAGMGPSEFLAAGYKAEQLRGGDAGTVQNSLLSAWASVQSMALLTPENLALMEQGSAPVATRGLDRGKPMDLDTSNLPRLAVVVKAPALPKTAAVAAPSPGASVPPVPEVVRQAPAFVTKRFDVQLHELKDLDAYGLKNMTFRLNSVNPEGSVSFLFADRKVHQFGMVNRWDGLNRVNPETGLTDAVNRTTDFTTELIPDTTRHGVKLLTFPFGAIYLDEDIGIGVTFHVYVRVASEALILDQLPPEKRKQYELNNP